MFFKKKKRKDEIELSEEQIQNLESIGITYVRKREKPDIITGKSENADIIIQMKPKRWKNIFAFLFLFLIIAPSIVIFIFLNINNIVTEDVVGASFNIGRVSVVPKSYRLNTKELSTGDIILYTGKNKNNQNIKTGIGSFIYKYEVGTVTRVVDDWWVYISIDGIKDRVKIPTSRIMYIKDTALEE